ncbi:glycoside hydrolase family 10 protein [Macrolepiota fuliginosa MF-IS2]|uniref:Beta-xylanase n=1 Tax=Macrolepiota fuliginosa MF-IS2 TaxID=1400762 RepID=A0A9P5XDA7_9AGAR|nr:glycoside hydrolase family 10 protein [Macrolepiota fuliginosa MF-IS2]
MYLAGNGTFSAVFDAANAQLNNFAQRAGKKYFGTATNEYQFNDTAYLKQLSNTRDFHQLTPAHSMKWSLIEPFQGVMNYTGANMVVEQAERHGQFIRGHNFVWDQRIPDWVLNGNFDNATMLSVIHDHCFTVARHFRGRMLSWDVVNEPINDDGSLKESLFLNTSGLAYIPTALRAARSGDPLAKLYINEFDVETINPKSTGLLNLIKALQGQGVPIDGVGVQAHLTLGQFSSNASAGPSLVANLRRFTNLGIEVAITELDVRIPTLPPTREMLLQQKEDYRITIDACKQVIGCIGVTVWDWTDRYSWIPGNFPGEGSACPWDENLKEKPAYQGIIDGFSI